MIKVIINAILHIIYPREDTCNFCKNTMISEEFICENCKELINLNGTIWYLRGDKYAQIYKEAWKREFVKEKQGLLYCHNVSYYSKIIKELIGEMKFKKNFYAMEYMAKLLYNYCKEIDYTPDIITFVPMIRKKEKIKGYNHSEVLAIMVSKMLKVPCKKLIDKKKTTREQKELTKDERWKNLKGSMVFNHRYKKFVYDKNILIIDDVITSGATVHYCYELIKRYTDKNITVLTVARSSI